MDILTSTKTSEIPPVANSHKVPKLFFSPKWELIFGERPNHLVIGAILVLALIIIIILLSIKLRSRRTVKARNYSPDVEKCDAHLMKECKEPCAPSSQGPDIIPEKSFFQVLCRGSLHGQPHSRDGSRDKVAHGIAIWESRMEEQGLNEAFEGYNFPFWPKARQLATPPTTVGDNSLQSNSSHNLLQELPAALYSYTYLPGYMTGPEG
ncbi:hypothetical protein CEXT_31091 [Caerostris extrusa]|uniref:Uncharacterized protein n=1 Tax=Caerostris extrusa TaxID=172846 RepID=A0AAV4P3V1_CAEEX|nr:hypothetical protein CEXT_31091 [Caerostris extrusa]